MKHFECACFRCSQKIAGNIPRLGCEKMSKKPLMFLMDGEGMYYPTYIPDGFEVINVENLSEQIFLISFENKNNEYLTFEEMTEDAESNIDTENAQVYYTEIHGNTALVSAKADLTIVSWNEQNRILSVVFDGEVEEDALKVAKSVTRIK